ncbi:hypothetical protein GCM10022421_08740 [Oceanisphaera sediminis]|uniref:Uncharacterized protein n=1 Tax=Oceanisphaera sediminis TaxID=981381 RepID=A0ABP7DGB0_9GAMM
MNQVAQLRPTGALSTEGQAMQSLVLFMTGELLPEMIFNWPNGANRIEQNLQGAAQVYARQLSGKGFTPALIRTALQAELESGRDFMPTPIQLANRCQQLQGGQQGSQRAPATSRISPAAIRLCAESQLYQDGKPTTPEAVDQAARQLTAEKRAQGVEISGGEW